MDHLMIWLVSIGYLLVLGIALAIAGELSGFFIDSNLESYYSGYMYPYIYVARHSQFLLLWRVYVT